MGAGWSGFFLLLLVSRRLLLVVGSVDIGERNTLIGQECEVGRCRLGVKVGGGGAADNDMLRNQWCDLMTGNAWVM